MNEIDPNVLIENLTELLTNSVNMTSVFYDLFINPEPMDVELKQFNMDGELVSVVVPNRAKDLQRALVGVGSPEGVVEAPEGTIYVDRGTQVVYVKTNGSDASGWSSVLTEEAVYAYVREYLRANEYINETSLAQYLVENNYTTASAVAEMIENASATTWVNSLETSGPVVLTDNTTYSIRAVGDISLIPPGVTNSTKSHKIMVQLNLPSADYNVEVGAAYFFDKIEPDFSEAGIYDIQYEYDISEGVWVCGTAIKGVSKYRSIPALYDWVADIAEHGGGGGWEGEIDDELSLVSENPVMNRVITEALENKIIFEDWTVD